MIEDMNARKLGAGTQRGHIHSCKRFTEFLKRSPDTATAERNAPKPIRLCDDGRSRLIAISGKAEDGMTYTIGFGMKNKRQVSTAEKPTAKEALALVDALQRSDEEIKFIRSPHRT
jgi:hypothetical protein